MSVKKSAEVVLVDQVEARILLLRGERVMLDADLAELYGTSTKAFNQAVKRNQGRFPNDFMFQLTAEEAESMRSQFVTASKRNVRFLPHAFTEHGAIMAASALNTPRAMEVSVYVVRAFVRQRKLLSAHKEIAQRLDELEEKTSSHDSAIQTIVDAIRQLMETPPAPKRPKIGFRVTSDGES